MQPQGDYTRPAIPHAVAILLAALANPDDRAALEARGRIEHQ